MKYEFGISSYKICVTDLSRVWSEALEQRPLVQRAWDIETDIDPIESDQRQLLLQKIKDSLSEVPGTRLALSRRVGSNGLQLTAFSPLPKPFKALQWPFYLSSSTQLTLTNELVLPLLGEQLLFRKKIETLLGTISEKDYVISKLTDKLQVEGIDLPKVFPGAVSSKSSRRSRQSTPEPILGSVSGSLNAHTTVSLPQRGLGSPKKKQGPVDDGSTTEASDDDLDPGQSKPSNSPQEVKPTIEGSSSSGSSSPEPAHRPRQDPLSKPKGVLGNIGGASKPSVSPGKPNIGHIGGATTNVTSSMPASKSPAPKGSVAKQPKTPPSPRETSQERADKKREQLKRELEEKSKLGGNTSNVVPVNPTPSVHVNTNPMNDVTVSRPAMRRRTMQSALSAAAPVFVPRQRIREGLPWQAGRHTSPLSSTWSTSTTPPSRPVYDNEVPQIPTHWIPIYGAGHGIFYDPLSKLFHNDGPPRPTLERADGTTQTMDDKIAIPRVGFRSEDILHLQPPSLTEPIVRSMEANHAATRRYYCRCRDVWTQAPHDCPTDGEQADAPLPGPGPPSEAAPGAIRPGQGIPPESFTHDLVVGDVSYVAPQQRYYSHGAGLPVPMPGVGGIMAVPSWTGGEGEQTRMGDSSGWAEEGPGYGKDGAWVGRGSVKGKRVPLRGKTRSRGSGRGR
ncbi:MAG: hypothetical protein LQ348_005889 [Seirophora lacunosa]|nr:MAG: hypothetical protein LQ348_005889 [Seirophora lacunosa]